MKEQLTLDYLDRLQQERLQLLDKFTEKLKLCGHLKKESYDCADCFKEGYNSLLALKYEVHVCGIRYCNKIDCIIQRFADVSSSFNQVKRFNSLRTLHHFVIGFEKVNQEDFENNFHKIKKRHEYILNAFMRKLRKAGINIIGYRVLDISKGKNKGIWDHKYYIHYHFIAIPFKSSSSRLFLSKIQLIRSLMLKRQKNKLSFHFQSFGLKEKNSLYSYLALRSIGLYKKFENKEKDYKIHQSRSLRKSLKEGKFMYLQELITKEQYLKYFFKHRHLTKIGDVPLLRYGSTTADNSVCLCCKRHGLKNIKDWNQVIRTVFIDPDPPPDDLTVKSLQDRGFILVNATKVVMKTEKEHQIFKEIKYFTSSRIIKILNPKTIWDGERDAISKKMSILGKLDKKSKILLGSSDYIELAIRGKI